MLILCWLISHDDTREFKRERTGGGLPYWVVRCRCARCNRLTKGWSS